MNLAQAKELKSGDRVKFTCEGPYLGDEGTVASVLSTGIEVHWDDGDEGETIGYPFRHDGYHFRNLAKL